MKSELDRLKFVEERDGLEGARSFAEQTFGLYKAALRKKNGVTISRYGQAYRRELIGSCLVFRRFLRDTERQAEAHARAHEAWVDAHS